MMAYIKPVSIRLKARIVSVFWALSLQKISLWSSGDMVNQTGIQAREFTGRYPPDQRDSRINQGEISINARIRPNTDSMTI